MEDSLGNTILDIRTGKDFMTKPPKAITIKVKINKLKKFHTAKKHYINRINGQPTEWEKVFANYASDNGLMSRIYRKPNSTNKPNNPIKKWAKDMTDTSQKKTYM